MNNKKSIKKNYFYNLIYTLLNTTLPLLTAPYLARVVGAEGIGIYAYYYATVHIFCIIAKLGLNNYGTRQISKSKKGNLSETFSSIFYQQIFTATIANIIYFSYCLIGLRYDSNQKYALIVGINLIATFFDIDWLFSGLESFKQISRKNILVKIISVICIFIFVNNENDLWKYILILSLSTFFGYLSMWINLKKNIRFVKVKFCNIIKHLKPNLILVIPVFAISIYRSMDKIMLGNMSTLEETGLYENAEKIIYALCGFITAFGTVMMPRISNMIENGKEKESQKYIGMSISFMMFMMFSMAFGLLAISDKLVIILFGANFSKSGILLGTLAFTLPCIGWANVIRSQYVIPKSKDYIYIITVVSGAIINLIINYIFIPKYNALGAVIGTLFAEASIPIVQFILLHKEIHYKKLFLKTIPSICCSIIMFVIIKSIEFINFDKFIELIIQIIVGILVYFICVVIYIIIFDKELLRKIKIKID